MDLCSTCHYLLCVNTHLYNCFYICYCLNINCFCISLLTKQPLKHLRNAIFTLIILCIPVCLFLFINSAKYTNQINGYYCDWSSLFIVIEDMFTPVLESLANNPPHYMHLFFTTLSLSKLIFIVLPVSAALFGIYTALRKDKFSYAVIAPAAVFLLRKLLHLNSLILKYFRDMRQYPCLLF